ncbi:MAG TPA: hypothetical protein VFC19_41575 [Candidatus Limnocylindrales bacterium]|nr:hypothetical protein [Candidatus Limnocylindrales bacterium]
MSDDADRFVGRAQPRPPRNDPPTEPLILPPPRRQRPVGLILGLIAGGFILLLLGIMAGFAFRFGAGNQGTAQPPAPPPTTAKAKPKPSPTPPADGPRAVTEKFLNAVRAGDQVTMQQQLCALLRDDNTAGASKPPDPGFLFSLGTLANFKVGEEKVNAVGASVQVEMTLPLVGTSNLEVYLVREGGGWRVCGAAPA